MSRKSRTASYLELRRIWHDTGSQTRLTLSQCTEVPLIYPSHTTAIMVRRECRRSIN